MLGMNGKVEKIRIDPMMGSIENRWSLTGTDLGGFQGAEGTPRAPKGVPGTPCGFGREEFLKCFYCQMRLPLHFLHFNKKFNYFLLSQCKKTCFYNFLQIPEIVYSVKKIINVGIQFLKINRNRK